MENNVQKQKKNVFGLLGFIFSFIPLIQPIALAFSIVGLARNKKFDGSFKGLSIAGLIISICQTYFCYILWVIIIWS